MSACILRHTASGNRNNSGKSEGINENQFESQHKRGKQVHHSPGKPPIGTLAMYQ